MIKILINEKTEGGLMEGFDLNDWLDQHAEDEHYEGEDE